MAHTMTIGLFRSAVIGGALLAGVAMPAVAETVSEVTLAVSLNAVLRLNEAISRNEAKLTADNAEFWVIERKIRNAILDGTAPDEIVLFWGTDTTLAGMPFAHINAPAKVHDEGTVASDYQHPELFVELIADSYRNTAKSNEARAREREWLESLRDFNITSSGNAASQPRRKGDSR
jgi:hypothetical protein